MNPQRQTVAFISLAAALLTSCATSSKPHGPPPPEVPKRWPSEQSLGEGLGSRGWDAMEKMWERALTHSPATRQQARKLRRLVWSTRPTAEIRWLSPSVALVYDDGGDGTLVPRIEVYCARENEWIKTRAWLAMTVEIDCGFSSRRTPDQEFVFPLEQFGM